MLKSEFLNMCEKRQKNHLKWTEKSNINSLKSVHAIFWAKKIEPAVVVN